MEPVLAVVAGGLYAAGVYLVLRRSIVKLVLGLALLAHAANLLIFTAGRLVRGQAPFAPASGTADPVPQALILTAIVIGFGVQAFVLALVKRAYRETASDDLDDMRTTER